MTKFDEQIVIVTGAASGLGLGIARAFHDAGASVVMGDVREDALDQARATFSDQERLAFVPVDVRDAAAVANLVATAEQAFGPPSVMIANAGIVPNKSVLNMDVTDWDAAIETNLRGVFSLLPVCGPEHGRARNQGTDRHHLFHRRSCRAVRRVGLLCLEGRHRDVHEGAGHGAGRASDQRQ